MIFQRRDARRSDEHVMKLVRRWDELRKTVAALHDDDRNQATAKLVVLLDGLQVKLGPIVDWTPAERLEMSEAFRNTLQQLSSRNQLAGYACELVAIFLEAQCLSGVAAREIESDGADYFKAAAEWAERCELENLSDQAVKGISCLMPDARAREIIDKLRSLGMASKTARECAETVHGQAFTDDEWLRISATWERAWKHLPQ